MELHVALTPDSLLYWFGWAVSLLIITFPIWFGRNLSIQGRRAFERGWAFILILAFAGMTSLSVSRGEFTWGGSLPIHMCGFSWLRSFGRIQLMAVIALGVNLLTGGNYMYLMEPPIVDNPLVIRSESFPYMHVVFFELFAALNFLLIEVVLRRIRVRNSIGVRVV